MGKVIKGISRGSDEMGDRSRQEGRRGKVMERRKDDEIISKEK